MDWRCNNVFIRNGRCNEKMKKIKFSKNKLILIPIFVILILYVFSSLYIIQKRDPSKPPSVLIGKDIPLFEIQNLYDKFDKINNEDLKNKYVLINFFASWCAPCKVEHPLFFQIKNNFSKLYLLGINHKDLKGLEYLNNEGNPYDFVGIDLEGSVSIEFGVLGLPETFLINPDGKIIYKHLGPLTKKIIKNEIEPLLP